MSCFSALADAFYCANRHRKRLKESGSVFVVQTLQISNQLPTLLFAETVFVGRHAFATAGSTFADDIEPTLRIEDPLGQRSTLATSAFVSMAQGASRAKDLFTLFHRTCRVQNDIFYLILILGVRCRSYCHRQHQAHQNVVRDSHRA